MGNDYRYERKFFVTTRMQADMRQLILTHPACFREIHHARWVNNIYLDTTDFRSYHDNVDGIEDRTKARVRWYGAWPGGIDRPRLELKRKRGHVGSKDSYALGSLELIPGFDADVVQAALDGSELPVAVRMELEGFEPKLLNRYSRTYYESLCKKYRVTLDEDLSFRKLRRFDNHLMSEFHDHGLLVLEVKYSVVDDSEAETVCNGFGLLLSRMSKYIHGVDRLFALETHAG